MSVVIESRTRTSQTNDTFGPVPSIEMRNVCKGFGSGVTRNEVLHNINLTVSKGEFVAIVGFSGSGKTTFTKLIAGLHRPDSGRVISGGADVSGPGADRGLVFQNYSLLPWLTVRGNIALSVDRVFSHWKKPLRRKHVENFIEMVGLSHAAHRRPHELSGGMRQRTSLARTLATKPDILLLDEPLSALDALTRSVMQQEILKIWEEERQTCLMITNDVDEAILVADRIIALTPGPKATLGREFKVSLDRPRDKTALNHDPKFKELRNEVTAYLVKIRDEARAEEQSSMPCRTITLPDLQPQSMKLPRKAILNSTI